MNCYHLTTGQNYDTPASSSRLHSLKQDHMMCFCNHFCYCTFTKDELQQKPINQIHHIVFHRQYPRNIQQYPALIFRYEKYGLKLKVVFTWRDATENIKCYPIRSMEGWT